MRCGKQQTTQNEELGRVVALQRGTAMVFGQNLPKNSAAEPINFATWNCTSVASLQLQLTN